MPRKNTTETHYDRSALREGIMQGIAELAKQRFIGGFSSTVQNKPVVPIDSDVLQVSDGIRRRMQTKNFLMTRDVAELFGVGVKTVQSWARSGELKRGPKHGSITVESIRALEKEKARQ